jgi:hypothetical protein
MEVVARVACRLRALVRPDGAVYAGSERISADLDLLSGSVLLALAQADSWTGNALDGVDVATVLQFYRRRFRLAHPWGMVWWHAQAWAALARPRREQPHREQHRERQAACADLVREILNWAVARQSRSSAAFVIEDMEPARVSFLSGCVLEGVADGWALACERGDADSAERYATSWRRGVGFLDRLTLHPEDGYFCARPTAAIGGVRATLPSSELRIDVAGHALRALAKGLRAERSA